MTTFITIDTEGTLLNEREVDQAIFARCPFVIFIPEHYDTPDGTSCMCYDAAYRKMMIREWGYTKKDFKRAEVIK